MAGRFTRSLHLSAAVEEPAVNLTPLIDVVFVILIMFIVIAPLLELDRIELAEAAAHPAAGASARVQEASQISIHVFEGNTIQFNGKKVSILDLKRLFQESKTLYPKSVPQLFHDRRAQFGIYQSIKNAAEEAGFQQIEIILKPA